jgi:hypothetical protein
MRHVGHEVAPDLVRAPQIADVMHHDDDTVRRVASRRCCAGDDRAGQIMAEWLKAMVN